MDSMADIDKHRDARTCAWNISSPVLQWSIACSWLVQDRCKSVSTFTTCKLEFKQKFDYLPLLQNHHSKQQPTDSSLETTIKCQTDTASTATFLGCKTTMLLLMWNLNISFVWFSHVGVSKPIRSKLYMKAQGKIRNVFKENSSPGSLDLWIKLWIAWLRIANRWFSHWLDG